MESLFGDDVDTPLGWMVLGVLISGVWLAGLVNQSYPQRGPRSAEGPGGYLDAGYNQQSNMNQTGVQDVQIPLDIRQEYARRHDLAVPSE